MDIIFDNIQSPKLLVVGEIILDVNIIGTYTRIADESPVPIFKETSRSYHLGGASNVFNNLSTLNCELLTFMTPIGDDEYTPIIKKLLISHNVIYIPFKGKNHVKTRYFADNILLYRADIDEKIVIDSMESIIPNDNKYDFFIVSDYNKGFLTTRFIEKLKESNVKIIVDPKNEIEKYNNCYLIKPNQKEYEKYDLNHESNTINNCQISIITKGSEGIFVCEKDKKPFTVCYKSCDKSCDTTGCGDIVLAVISYLIGSAHIPLKDIVDLSCFLATQSINKIGCQLINYLELITYASVKKSKLLHKKDLQYFKNINNVIFTNGCFDIFHHGHLKLLNFAKAQGDILIVGLNSDDSIKRLKGNERPINKLETRKELLQSLDIVDFIIVYDDDTPFDILKLLSPNTIVKGSDYTESEIIGREFAQNVKLFQLDQTISTTKIVNKVLFGL